MATVTPTRPGWDRDESQRRVRHPLQRLRGYIRWYVTAEGLVVLGLYLALWFWLGLALDYGAFKIFGVDWLQHVEWGFRAGVLGLLVAGLLALVAAKVLLRLFREFSDPALALVLERRFPKQFGDRLITAVELADPRLAERYGFSQAMIDHTVEEAAAQVDQVPVQNVFNWDRLRRARLWVAGLTVGVLLLVGIVGCIATASGPGTFAVRFWNVVATWFERNVLLRDRLWPRSVHLELVGFPDSGELRIGRDAAAPTLRARAVKWVVADGSAPGGWRAMRWDDLTPDLLGADLPALDLPEEWNDWNLDQVELELKKREVRSSLPDDTRKQLDWIVDEQLPEQSHSAWMERRLRMLIIPKVVEVHYRGATIRDEQKLPGRGDNEFSGNLPSLKESIRFTLRAEDFSTAEKRITLVPPPSLMELIRVEHQPAYLYHRLPKDGTVSDLKGKKQKLKEEPVSLSGTTSRLDVPAGSDVVLRGASDKPLQFGDKLKGVRILRDNTVTDAFPIRQSDAHYFEVRFAKVTEQLDFQFELIDADNVIGRRHVLIRPQEDRPPDIDVLVEYLPRRKGNHLITPSARIPLSGKVRDDHGLDKLEYVFTVVALDAQVADGVRSLVGGLQFVSGGQGRHLLGAVYVAGLAAQFADDAQTPRRILLESFVKRLERLAADDLTAAELAKLLATAQDRPKPRPLREHPLEPDQESDNFSVERLGLKVKDEKQVQPRYRLQLWLVAVDNNIETGPSTSAGKERFIFQIVSEYELLAEIAKDEEGQHVKLLDAVNKLREARTKLDQVIRELPELKPEEFSPMARRSEEFLDVLLKAGDICREVHTDYRKILKELQVNQVHAGHVRRVRDDICDPLERALGREFLDTEEALRAFRKLLEERKYDKPATDQTRQQFDKLLDRLNRVLDAMGEVMNYNKLVTLLVEIERAQRVEVTEALKKLREEYEKKLLEGLFEPKKK